MVILVEVFVLTVSFEEILVVGNVAVVNPFVSFAVVGILVVDFAVVGFSVAAVFPNPTAMHKLIYLDVCL